MLLKNLRRSRRDTRGQTEREGEGEKEERCAKSTERNRCTETRGRARKAQPRARGTRGEKKRLDTKKNRQTKQEHHDIGQERKDGPKNNTIIWS